MIIGVLKTDSVRAEFQAEFGDYPDMFKRLLSPLLNQANSNSHEAQYEFVTYDVEHDQFPSAVDACDAYIITGSRHSAYDDLPWIEKLKQFVVAIDLAKVKLVGICFGHQIVALALGGHVERASVGWGVGRHVSHIKHEAAFMVPQLSSYSALVSHQDQVTKLPPRAQLLATSDFCPNSMFLVEQHILTFQGHPEFESGYSKALMNFRREIIGKVVYLEGQKSLAQSIDTDLMARWILNFLNQKGH